MLTVGDKLPAFNLQSVVSLEPGKEFKEISDKKKNFASGLPV